MNLRSNRHIIRKLNNTIILVISVLVMSFAQEGKNPFEISGRSTNEAPPLNSTTVATPIPTDTTDTEESFIPPTIEIDNDNPFEVRRPDSAAPKVTSKNKKDSSLLSTANPRDAGGENSNSFLFIVIMIMMVLFATLMTLFREYVGKTYEAFINNSQMNAIYRELGSTIPFHYLILYFMFFVNAAIFVFLYLKYSNVHFASNWMMLLTLLGAIILIFVIKHSLLKILSWVFPISKELDLYNFSIIIFNITIGILLIPFNLLMAYAPSTLTLGVLYTLAFLVVAIYAYRSIRGILIGSKYLSMHKFLFFMYLCTIEIIPVMILIKFVKNLM